MKTEEVCTNCNHRLQSYEVDICDICFEKMTMDKDELFTAVSVFTAYTDEDGNVTCVKSSWDDLFKKEDNNA